MDSLVHNCVNGFCKDAVADHNRVSGGAPSTKVPDSAQKWKAEEAPTVSKPSTHQPSSREKRTWRRRFGRFVADECGVRFETVSCHYDPKRAEKTIEKRDPLTDADVRESERFLEELIKRPTIDPNQEAPVVIQGEALPALKAAMLQGLGRASRPRGASSEAPRGGK